MYSKDIMKIVFGMVLPLIVAILYLSYLQLNHIRFFDSSVPIKIILILIPALLILNVGLSVKFGDEKTDDEESIKSSRISTGHLFAGIVTTLLALYAYGRSIF